MKIRKSISLFLALVMAFTVFALVACGPKQSPEEGGPPPDEGQTTPPDENDGEKEELPDRDFPYVNFDDDKPAEEYEFDDSLKYEYTCGLRNVAGIITESEGIFTSASSNAMAVCETEPFPYGTISCTVRTVNTTDSGIIFSLTDAGDSYWESGVSYYFFFLGQGGTAYLGKVDKGSWSALYVMKTDAIQANRDYRLKVVLKGNKIVCYVDDLLMFGIKDENFLTGTGYGVRTGAVNVIFSDLNVTNEYLYE